MTWHIVGNGPLFRAIAPTVQLVVFNQGFAAQVNACRITNQRLSGAELALVVSGKMPFAGFTEAINQRHTKLQATLHAVPSSGLCAAAAFIEKGLPAQVNGMTLLPSLARSNSLEARQPMPCYFHNWLAERRYMMPYLSALSWPQFYLAPLQHAKSMSVNPYELLAALYDMDKAAGLTAIQQLAVASADSWLAHNAPAEAGALDTLFYLPRDKSRSPNWWLFDDTGAALMAKVHHQLAWAQQQRLMPA